MKVKASSRKKKIIKELVLRLFSLQQFEAQQNQYLYKSFQDETIWLMFHMVQNAKEHILSLDLYAQAYMNCMNGL